MDGQTDIHVHKKNIAFLTQGKMYVMLQVVTRDAYSSGHLVLSHLGLAYIFYLLSLFPKFVTIFLRISLVTSILLDVMMQIQEKTVMFGNT